MSLICLVFTVQDLAQKYHSSESNIRLIFESFSTFSGHDLRMDKVKHDFIRGLESFSDLKAGTELKVWRLHGFDAHELFYHGAFL